MTVLTEVRPPETEATEPAISHPLPPSRGLVGRLVRGRQQDPAWVRPALLALLTATGVSYLWALGDSGWANSFYSAAVQAGTKSWKAFFFGSSDASNFITVDKPPAALWVMELSARLFGLSSWSILVPQALEGVATVALLYATVRRWFSPAAALLAGAVMASTPVAVLMFRYNNPDALLVLLLTVAAYATVRALERASTWWLVIAFSAVGTGFLTKMLQAFLVLPAIGLAYLLASPTTLSRRIRQLLIAGGALIVSTGWWVAAVQLTPAADRPYIGGSQDNSLLNLIFGYNGFGRLSGNESGSVGGAGAAGSRWGPTGILRLFRTDMGGQISWLLPGALIFLVGLIWWSRKAPRTDRTRAALVLFGGWLVVTALVFSFAQGIIHPYYNVALAPAIGAVVGIGTVTLWHMRTRLAARVTLATAVAASAIWSYVLLARSPHWLPWLGPTVLVAGGAAALLLVFGTRLGGKALFAVGAMGVAASMAGPVAYGLDTVGTPHAGAIPSAGPAVALSSVGPGVPGGGRGGPFSGAQPFARGAPAGRGVAGGPPFNGGSGNSQFPLARGAAGPGLGPGSFGGGQPRSGGFSVPGGSTGGRGVGAQAGGGFLGSTTPGKAVVELLQKDSRSYKWIAATVNSNSAAGYQLATGDPVMAVGGFNGTDPTPTLSQFERYVEQGKLHYFIVGGGGPGTGGTGSTAGQITQWVENNFKTQTVDGVTLYDLQS